jgi:hypothetical protein
VKKPSNKYPGAVGSFGTLTPADLPDPSLNAEAYDQLIQNRGILFTYTKAMPCPNVQDVESQIHVNHCTHPRCWNGMLQVQPKQVWGYFNNDQLSKLFEIQGEYNQNIAIITIAATNTDGTEADVHPFDQLIADEYTKRVYELVESSPTGLDRLNHYAIDVLQISTVTKDFTQGVDYVIEGGKIRWVSQNRPTYNQQLQRGEAFSIAYYIRPVFYVSQVMKELRASQVFDPMTNEKIAVRLPQHLMVLRELLSQDDTDKIGNSTSKAPPAGVLTPR